MTTIDLNSDLGESVAGFPLADDAAVLDIVTSANVACGYHAGEPHLLRRTLAAAAERGVAVGAHPSYNDPAGFGRRAIDYDAAQLADELLYQLGALDTLARAAGTRVSYVKPHGALYNRIVHDEEQARAVVDAVRAFGGGLALLLLPGSVAIGLAEAAGIRAVAEAFADRGYTPEGTLVPRTQPGAVIADPQAAADRVVRLATEGTLEAVDGSVIRLSAESVCVHGDSPDSVELSRRVRAGLEEAGVQVRSFA
ncbi:LamB/YcsF family protein [Brevibacterium sp. BRM-1]|uniref:LamB/YcsF family protein n=1 Tax=Brevibacterium sp. BRM-1 TaxID=2999062 RepID=UPI002281CA95|nr:5-oxoprolinase subunit PxpA [Brevibacterium sp. BRM-1]WAL39937.1 LamB/YcsF family protein [Brevibacterium sp. BRM-1]